MTKPILLLLEQAPLLLMKIDSAGCIPVVIIGNIIKP